MGCSMPWSHNNPATTLPMVLQMPAEEIRKAADLGWTPLAMAMSGRWVYGIYNDMVARKS